MKIILIISLLMLSACTGFSGALPWNKQNYAGINSVHFKWCELGDKYQPCDVSIINGKEAGVVELKFEMPDGTILNYGAESTRAFEGQAIRGDVEKKVAEESADTVAKVADVIAEVIKP